MDTQEQAIKLLCMQIEAVVGRTMRTPRDYEFLSECIFDKLHQTISPTTLKRIWGYLPESVTPRLSTLNLLAQFLDISSWDAFCEQQRKEQTEEEPRKTDVPDMEDESALPSASHARKGMNSRSLRWMFITILLVFVSLFGLIIYNFASPNALQLQTATDTISTNRLILRQGQIFEDYEDYHRLFGITDTETPWSVVLPHHPFVIVWTPEYQNSIWHNYGDSASMFPTITEEWDSGNVSQEHVRLRNKDHYATVKRLGEVRITFMKNLIGSSTVFLGIYRMDRVHSDTTHVVWERIAEECDLNRLDYIEELRN